MIVPVILSGGSGTRLWPLSRELYPKQLLPLVGPHTMLQETVMRLSGLEGLEAPMVVCNENHRFMVAEQLRSTEHSPSAILLEPVGRNTAPAVAVAAIQATGDGRDPVLLVLPADHIIQDAAALRSVVKSGVPWAEKGKLITFGIVPRGPETGYGYIRADKSRPLYLSKVNDQVPMVNNDFTNDQGQMTNDATAYAVAEFVEKPDLATAHSYVNSGEYYWNSGMFMFRASRFLEELERFAPEMLASCRRALEGAGRDLDFVRLDADAFTACPGDSIDYAVMEKTSDAVVLPLDAGWNDVGSWSALWEAGGKDADGNAILGDVLTRDVRNCYLYSGSRMVAAVGLEDHVVVETADAVLVAPKDRVQDVKHIVEQLKAQGRGEALLHRRVNRPWGSYECIDSSERFQVKHITVHPGASLSLQMHHHRAEHWVIVKGTARVTRGEETFTLSENESTYIPLGVNHRLENPGKIPLEIIEVQSGSYLGEDDIVRFDDKYGR
ncbi:mannose-1-phosphate guanylyltransferase/mannose-6-phosphate isomerase [Desulfuromonas sp. TF]|uniref:mannose-1-phosphate guanylyltransferase/mannose-6-phosphate isomerase n=1 Tax=Desulfuromonas sp. TF TaxID=1232410 RepID=UPI000408479C|nr:mannose-1-phosphate guanylyltransferase/mannose-6-phosphate isomerase [Desulfuromonas sp. TF]